MRPSTYPFTDKHCWKVPNPKLMPTEPLLSTRWRLSHIPEVHRLTLKYSQTVVAGNAAHTCTISLNKHTSVQQLQSVYTMFPVKTHFLFNFRKVSPSYCSSKTWNQSSFPSGSPVGTVGCFGCGITQKMYTEQHALNINNGSTRLFTQTDNKRSELPATTVHMLSSSTSRRLHLSS